MQWSLATKWFQNNYTQELLKKCQYILCDLTRSQMSFWTVALFIAFHYHHLVWETEWSIRNKCCVSGNKFKWVFGYLNATVHVTLALRIWETPSCFGPSREQRSSREYIYFKKKEFGLSWRTVYFEWVFISVLFRQQQSVPSLDIFYRHPTHASISRHAHTQSLPCASKTDISSHPRSLLNFV